MSNCFVAKAASLTLAKCVDTPAFLLWSLEYTCSVRGFESGHDPERSERLLRSARVASEAVCENRVLDGIGVDPPYGFKLAEVLALYGGQPAVEAACRHCPANAAENRQPGLWAGCFGIVPLPDMQTILEPALQSALSQAESAGFYAQQFVRTEPVWYGLWLQSPLSSDRAAALSDTFQRAGLDQTSDAFAELLLGLQAAAKNGLPFHFLLYPPGRVEQGWWRRVPHCPRCQAPWSETTARHCSICEYRGAPAPDKKRRARGRRPYLALQRLLGEAKAAEFLAKYADHRKQ